MKSRRVLAVAGLMLMLFAGCDPFETELTLNADGSGTMVQKGQLSPGGRMMLTQGFGRGSPYRDLLTEEAVRGTPGTAATGGSHRQGTRHRHVDLQTPARTGQDGRVRC